jgi:rhomboid family GlyGly-CTERM serine protease
VNSTRDILRVGRRIGAPLVLCVAAVVLHFVPGARAALEYDRAAVAAGEAWRFASGQLVHGNFAHLIWDVAATLALGIAVAWRRPLTFLAVVGVSGVAIPLGVHLFLPSLTTFCGLSGIASALFATYAVGVVAEGVRERRWGVVTATGVVVIAFAVKLAFEATTGTAVFVDLAATALVPVPLAHLLGAAVGSAGGLFGLAPGSFRTGLPAV